MRKILRVICIVLVLSVFFTIPTNAQSVLEPRGSAFFAAYSTDLYKTSSTSFQIWFDVDANAAMMQELGVSEIALYRSTDQESWTLIKTYEKGAYSVMTDTYVYSHTGYVTYNFATTGYYYTARITFYAKNSTGIGERDIYTEILKM